MLNTSSLIVGATSVSIAYFIFLVIYRLYFQPLAKFPGSKLAASSLWYEFYYDVVLRGKFMWRIKEMHEQYGPIIRINPNELHISDPDYYDEIYGSATRKRDKYGPWVVLSGTPGASFATVSHDHHKLRRGALNPFFSTKAVNELEPVIKSKVELFASRFEDAADTGQIIRVDVAFMALTMDVISQYAFAKDDNMISKDDFNVAWKETVVAGFESGALVRQFPLIMTIITSIPDNVVKTLMPGMSLMLEWKTGIRNRIIPILSKTESVAEKEDLSHRSIFHELRDSNLPPTEKTIDRLSDEALVFTGAGSETTAKVLTTAIFYLHTHKECLAKLRKELTETGSAADTWSKLSQLTYLSAVLSESMRLSLGITTRLPRIATEEILDATQYFILMNPTIFPEPNQFRPERWIDKNGKYDHGFEKRYLVNFGKGSRSCLGINLAYAEMYLTLATLIRRFDMELYETTTEDVTMVHDFFVAIPRLHSKGVRVKVAKAY